MAGLVAAPAGDEIAVVVAGELRAHVPAQRRRPADGAGGVEAAGGHGRQQLLQHDLFIVAAAVELQFRLLLVAQQGGRADRGPRFQLARDSEIAAADDARLRLVAPCQFARVDREAELRILRIGEVGGAAQAGGAVQQAQRQRFDRQHLVVVDAHARRFDHGDELVLLDAAL